MNTILERLEIDRKARQIFCPICTQQVVELNKDKEPDLTPCEHFLYLSHDMGVLHMSERFKNHLKNQHGIAEWSDDEPLDLELGIQGTIQLEQYEPAPNLFGTYYGFVD